MKLQRLKYFLFLLLCAAVGVPAFADGTINMNNPSASTGTGWTFSTGDSVVRITADGAYTVTGGSTTNRIVINKNVTATVTLQNASIHSAVASPFMLSSDTIAGGKGSQVTLNLIGTNELVTTEVFSAGLTVEDSAKLTIDGTGSLLAQGAGNIYNSGGAGIGGGYDKAAGTVIIQSGTVTATGGFASAGIGGGAYRTGGSITVADGTITATGGMYAAGIGGGYDADGGNITVTGGTITAHGGEYHAAGIGGSYSGNGGNITVTGGTITAISGQYAAGIGGGSYGSGGNITITSGTITATARMYAAGIGGGSYGSGGNITITSGTITATGGMYAAGIGGGYSGNGGSITVTGGTITSTGGDSGSGIGGGVDASGGNITVAGGKITATGGSSAAGIGGGYAGNGGNITHTGGTITAIAGQYAAGIGGGYTGDGGNITIRGGVVVAVAPGGEGDPAGIGGGRDAAGAGTINITGGTVYASGGTGPGIGAGARATGGVINISGGVVIADEIGIGNANGRTETHITGASAVVLSPSINTTTFGGAQVLTGTNIGISCSVAEGNIDYKVTLNADLTIPAGCTLTVPEGIIFDVNHKALKVAAGGSLVCYGSLIHDERAVYDTPATSIADTALIDMDTTKVGGAGFAVDNGRVVITHSGNYIITGQSTSRQVWVNNNVTADITLQDADIESSSTSPFYLSKGDALSAVVTLRLEGDNRLVTTKVDSAGLTVEDNARLTIEGPGSLLAQGGGGSETGGAGIGSGDGKVAGTITIRSGAVTAKGGAWAAGIGGGNMWEQYAAKNNVAQPNGGNIMITGGTVTATGGQGGAGIGGGGWGRGGSITISGGTVKATGGELAAGIGGGYDADGGEITVTGGVTLAVTQSGYGSPAGMGGGAFSKGAGAVRITGGTVYASAGTGAGIGGGAGATEGAIDINGGTVIAAAIGIASAAGQSGESRTSTGVSGKQTIVLSQAINTTTFGGAQVIRGDNVRISDPISADDDLTDVMLYTDLTVPAGGTLTIPEGIIFDVNNRALKVSAGSLTCYGKLLNAGRLEYIYDEPADSIADTSLIDISAADSVSTDSAGYTVDNDRVVITRSGNYIITGASTSRRVWVNNNVTADITLDNADIESFSGSAFHLQGGDALGADVTLRLVGANRLVTTEASSSGLRVEENALVTIEGGGSLVATATGSNGWAAGIGGERDTKAGTINITGGAIYASSGTGPGIGGSAGAINITSGTVIANGIGTGSGSMETRISGAQTIVLSQAINTTVFGEATVLTGDSVWVSDHIDTGDNSTDVTLYSDLNIPAGSTFIIPKGIIFDMNYRQVEDRYGVIENYGSIIHPGKTALQGGSVAFLFPSDSACVYTGYPIKPEVRVTHYESTLAEGTDYTVSYSGNVNAGTATVIVTGAGNYGGTASLPFTILPKPVAGEWIEDIPAGSYTGDSIKPAVTVRDGDRILEAGKDYSVEYSGNVNAGSGTVRITGLGNYGGTATQRFTIHPKPIADEWVDNTAFDLPYTYTGDSIKLAVTVRDGGRTLVPDTDYTVNYSGNVNVGTATATVAGAGNYTGSVSRSFLIMVKQLQESWIEYIPPQTWTGDSIKPVVVKDGDSGRELIAGADYTIKYVDNVNVNTATFTITGRGNYVGSASGTFEIVVRAITDSQVDVPAVTYTGFPLEPAVTVAGLVEGRDYTVQYVSATEAGSYEVRVTGKDNCTGEVVKPFVIGRKPVTGEMIAGTNRQSWTGQPIEPALVIDHDRGVILQKGVEYAIAYFNNTAVGEATFTVTGLGNYGGTVSGTFAIASGGKPVLAEWIEDIPAQTYTGSAIEPEVEVAGLALNTDYTVAYSGNVNAGEATVMVMGAGDYTGSAVTTFTILPKPVSGDWLENIPGETYTGSAIQPAVTIRDGAKILESGRDYITAYANNTNAGTARVTVTGAGNYAGTVSRDFTISPKPVAGEWLDSIPAGTYTGDSIKPALTIRDGNRTLSAGTDYSVNYSNNTNAGTATITVTGTGNYTGTAIGQFTIAPRQIAADWVQLIPDQPYTGSAVNPAVTVTGLVQDVDYTVSCSDNIQIGTATVTITGKGNYTGEVTLPFNITTGIKEATNTVLRIISASDGIFISGLTPGATFSIYTLQGQLIYEAQATSPEERIYLRDKGVYILYHAGQYSKFSR